MLLVIRAALWPIQDGRWADHMCEKENGYICKKKASSYASAGAHEEANPGCKLVIIDQSVIISQNLSDLVWQFVFMTSRAGRGMVLIATTLDWRKKLLMRQRKHVQRLVLTWWMWLIGKALSCCFENRPFFAPWCHLKMKSWVVLCNNCIARLSPLCLFMQIWECLLSQYDRFETREAFLDRFFQHRWQTHFQVDDQTESQVHLFQRGPARYNTLLFTLYLQLWTFSKSLSTFFSFSSAVIPKRQTTRMCCHVNWGFCWTMGYTWLH